MYELEEFERRVREKRWERGTLRKAIEEGRIRPIAMRLPKPVNRRRRNDVCSTKLKVIVVAVFVTLIFMLSYSVWRIRNIEEVSETSDYEYRMISTEAINRNVDEFGDNIADVT